MHPCPGCGAEVADGARFCSECGAPQPAATEPAPAVAASEERRFVSILFVDLVGFTERSDMADPEDVRTTLLPYHARAKEIIERYGGTLDKFIGDAVMGVFGAPVAHEDDPARAVHASLRILAAIEDLRVTDPALQVRIAVNSGEAVVTAGTGPQVGEAVAGDVVNTASRMQALAPPGGLVVGPVTERLVRERFETEALPPAMVKGKSEPIQVWRVLGEREASASVVSAAAAGFVGRERELALLVERFDLVSRTARSQVLTVVGEPGIGKSRLVEEFRLGLGDVRWLEGRSVPYGEVSAFEPVAMVLREVAGITPSDDPETTRSKLDGMWAHSGDRAWALSRLCALLGVADGSSATGAGSETVGVSEMVEAFATAVLPAGLPTVLVIQDLHWADDVMIEFLGLLAGVLRDRAVLLLATARIEFLDRAGWPPADAADAADAAGAVTTLHLPPLGPRDTERLMRSLLVDGAFRQTADATILERSGGNPLYAVEFARMLIDRGHDADGTAAVPESIRSVIAARIDVIPQELRSIVVLASVVGVEFWAAAIAGLDSLAEDRVLGSLRVLAERDVVRETRTTLAGHPAFGFAHDLIREVAYARIPRRRRAHLHVEVADWLEAETGDRAEERAELLAGHFERAVEYGLASRQDDLVARARDRAARWLLIAADRALRVDAAGSFALYERTLAVEPADPSERADALVGSARTGRRSGKLEAKVVLRRLEEALVIERELGDAVGTGRVLTRLASQLGAGGETARARVALTEAIELLEREGAPHELATAYAYRAEDAMFAGRVDDAFVDAERALSVLGEDATDAVAIMLLHIRGDARCSRGDRGGLADLERAVALSSLSQSADEMVTSENYLASWLWAYVGPVEARAHMEMAIELADRRGVVSQGVWAKAESFSLLVTTGDLDTVAARAEEILAVGRERVDALIWLLAEVYRARVLRARGRPADRLTLGELLGAAEEAEDDLQVLCPVLLAAAAMALADGRPDQAVEYLRRLEAATRDAAREYRELHLAEAVDLCASAGALDVAEDLIARSDGDIPLHRCNLLSAEARLLEAKGDHPAAADAYARAAEAWEAFGVPYQTDIARQRAARALASAGGPDPTRAVGDQGVAPAS